MVEAIFRLLLANGNTPMSAEQLAARLNRPAETILKTITGGRVYKGLRPYVV
jgi:biotin operon repressor